MSFEGTIQSIARQLALNFGAEICTIRVPCDKYLKIIAAYGIEVESREEEIEINETTIAGQTAITKQVQNVHNITQDQRYDPAYIHNEKTKALLCIPLVFEDELYGVAQIYKNRPFRRREIAMAVLLAQSAALTLYHIEASKTSRKAILEVVSAIFNCTTLKEMFEHAVKVIAERLGIESCLVYKIFTKHETREPYCEIMAGVPFGEHKIGLSNPLSAHQHKDIAYTIIKRELTILDPTAHEEAEHLREWSKNKNIRLLMEYPLILGSKDKPEGEKIVGVVVAEAKNDKYGFSAEEKSFFADAGKILATFIEHDQESFREIAHGLLNPNTSMGGYAKRLQEPLAKIYALAEKCCEFGNCTTSQQILAIAGKILPRASEIEAEAKRIDLSFSKIKNSALS